MSEPTKICSNKNCHLPGESRPLGAFALNATGKHGVREICKSCVSKKQNARRAELRNKYKQLTEPRGL